MTETEAEAIIARHGGLWRALEADPDFARQVSAVLDADPEVPAALRLMCRSVVKVHDDGNRPRILTDDAEPPPDQ